MTFRDAETFTDLPQGAVLIPDIVAEERTRRGEPRLIIVQVEIQREREAEDVARGMYCYVSALA